MDTVACNLCGSTDQRLVYEMPDRYYFPEERFRVVECEVCGLGFVNPRPSFAEIQKYYPPAYYERFSDHSKWNSKRFARQASFLQDVTGASKSKTLLDIGCANGDFPRFMMRRGWNVEGVEVSASIPPTTDLKVYTQQFHEIPVFEARYDAITAWAVIEHVHDPRAYFRKAGEVIKKGGQLVLLVQNFDSLASRYLFCEDVPRHLYFFNENTVGRYLEAAGFDLLESIYDDSIYSMVAVNWWPFLIKAKIRRRAFRFEDRHPTRVEYLNRLGLRPGCLSTLRYMTSVPEAVVEQAVMPVLTRVQIWRRRFGTCIYIARKK